MSSSPVVLVKDYLTTTPKPAFLARVGASGFRICESSFVTGIFYELEEFPDADGV